MGQKVNPIGNRLGIIRGWDSNWFGGRDFSTKIVEDHKIRAYLNTRLAKANLSKIIIERTLKLITVTIHSARPGTIIGPGGTVVDNLKEELKKITSKDIQINIFEVKRPELDSVIVANNIARQVEGRVSYRRAIKMTIASTMRMGAEGIKIQISGRLGGAEMARSETYKEGRIPLHTFRANIDYALGEALTKVGLLGIKVWICNGLVYGKRDLEPNVGVSPANLGYGERSDRDRNRGDRDRNRGDRNRGDRDRNRGGGDRNYGDRDRNGGDRDRNYGGGDRDRNYGGGDRNRNNSGGGDRNRNYGGGGDRNRNNSGGGDRNRNNSGGGDRNRNYGGGGDRNRNNSGGGNRNIGGGNRSNSGGGDRNRNNSGGGGDRNRNIGGGDRNQKRNN
jgi:small subunit ribosomal protein S3